MLKRLNRGEFIGHNLSHLTFEFDAVAVDISEAMLEECRKLNPGVELHLGDMRSVRLGKKFPAYRCIEISCLP